MIDPHSSTWRDVAAWAAVEVDKCRVRLDDPATDHPTTMLMRGRLATLRDLLALTAPPPPPFPPTETRYT
jgi:hypothetical protein